MRKYYVMLTEYDDEAPALDTLKDAIDTLIDNHDEFPEAKIVLIDEDVPDDDCAVIDEIDYEEAIEKLRKMED